VFANDQANDFTGINRVGFVVSNPNADLLNLSLLGDFITLQFYNDGTEVGSADVDGGLLALSLLGVGLDDGQRFLSAPVDPATTPFDEVRLEYAGVLSLGLLSGNDTLRVHKICAGVDATL
jgi:hypothetical protein